MSDKRLSFTYTQHGNEIDSDLLLNGSFVGVIHTSVAVLIQHIEKERDEALADLANARITIRNMQELLKKKA